MEQFLITVIFVLVLVLVAVIQVVRMIFRFSHPYHHVMPTAPVAGGSRPEERSSPWGTMIVVLTVALAFLIILRPNSSSSVEDTYPQEAPIEQVRDKEPIFTGGNNTPSSRPRINVKPSRSDEYYPSKHFTENTQEAEELTPIYFNESPQNVRLTTFYAIQISAYMEKLGAIEEVEKLQKVYRNLRILHVDNEPVPYKVTIGEFAGEDEAKNFQKENLLPGFIQVFEYK